DDDRRTDGDCEQLEAMRAEPERAQNEIGGAAEGTDDSGDQEEIRCSRQCGLPDAEALVTDDSCRLGIVQILDAMGVEGWGRAAPSSPYANTQLR
ncbi:MAG: hypothetical protein ACXWXC_09615, partial [Aeromicrobium sp.]